jgi:hypothetical protein
MSPCAGSSVSSSSRVISLSLPPSLTQVVFFFDLFFGVLGTPAREQWAVFVPGFHAPPTAYDSRASPRAQKTL